MGNCKSIKTTDGSVIEYIDDVIGEGGMKKVYFTSDNKHVVAFYKDAQDYTARDRLDNIVDKYCPLNDRDCGDYWKNLYCWPSKVVDDGVELGVLAPRYPEHFFFKAGPMKGREKEGKWFVSSKLRKLLDPAEKGTWLDYYQLSILLSRAVRRMHTSGLAHSDLSYKNVLIDPKGGHAAIIDIDGLVVPNKFPPDVLGTPDFIAPEIFKTLKLDLRDKNRILPSRYTDLHALGVLIYMYLLYRHPLRGRKVHDLDPGKDEKLSMGEKALFVEHPTDKSNRPNEKDPAFMPWADVNQIPYTVTGPYLKELFDMAFIDGLHNPAKRPTADRWEDALVKTIDLMQPCGNAKCEQKWFVFDNSTKPQCPFCGWKFKGELPVLNLYSSSKKGNFRPDNHRLMVYNNQYLYPWHANRRIAPNEKLKGDEKKPIGYFVFHNDRWVFVNQNAPNMKDLTKNKDVPIGSMVELKDGKKILFSRENGGRLAFVQMVTV